MAHPRMDVDGTEAEHRSREIALAAAPRGCVSARATYIIKVSCPDRGTLLGGRSTVGHVALDHVIGVRIPASQPTP